MDQTERNIATIKERFAARVAILKDDLYIWIDDRRGAAIEHHLSDRFSGPFAEITVALLETAMERLIQLHGSVAARDFASAAFERQVEKHKRSLQ
jgi:hypothetical protein